MPYATHWVCCKCGFGPMLIENYPACLNCQHRGARGSCCTLAALDGAAAYSAEAAPANEPARNHCNDNYDNKMDSSFLESSPRHFDDQKRILREPQSPQSPRITLSSYDHYVRQRGRSDLYICCQCGDGPQVFQLQPRCVMCQHDACRYCTHVKY